MKNSLPQQPLSSHRNGRTYKKLLKHRARNGCAESQEILKSWHAVDSLGRERVPRRRLTPIERLARRMEGVTLMKGVILVDDPVRTCSDLPALKDIPCSDYNFHKEYMQQPAQEPFAFNKAKYRPPFWAAAIPIVNRAVLTVESKKAYYEQKDMIELVSKKMISEMVRLQAQNPDKEFTSGDIEGPIEEGNKVKFRFNMYFKDK